MAEDSRVESVLRDLNQAEPPAGLVQAVFLRIDAERRRALAIRRIASSSVALASLAAFGAGVVSLVNDFRESGFGSYLSLIFTDGRLILSFWADFMYSLAESLPVLSLSACALSLFSFLAAARLAARYLNGRRGMARPA